MRQNHHFGWNFWFLWNSSKHWHGASVAHWPSLGNRSLFVLERRPFEWGVTKQAKSVKIAIPRVWQSHHFGEIFGFVWNSTKHSHGASVAHWPSFVNRSLFVLERRPFEGGVKKQANSVKIAILWVGQNHHFGSNFRFVSNSTKHWYWASVAHWPSWGNRSLLVSRETALWGWSQKEGEFSKNRLYAVGQNHHFWLNFGFVSDSTKHWLEASVGYWLSFVKRSLFVLDRRPFEGGVKDQAKSVKIAIPWVRQKSPFLVKFWICVKLNQTLSWGFARTLTKFGEEISLRSQETALQGRS